MTTLEKSFTINLTETEVKYITDALHLYYKTMRDEEDPTTRSKNFETTNYVRVLRNHFGNLFGRCYIGSDA